MEPQEASPSSNIIMTTTTNSQQPPHTSPMTSYETFSNPTFMEDIELSQQSSSMPTTIMSATVHHHHQHSTSRLRRHKILLENEQDLEENVQPLEHEGNLDARNDSLTSRHDGTQLDQQQNDDDHHEHSNPIQSHRLESIKNWKTRVKSLANCLFHNLLLIFTLIGVVLGLIIGVSVNVAASEENSTIEITPEVVAYVKLPGDLLLRALNCLIVPLIVSSMISSITSIVDSVNAREETVSATSLTQHTSDMANFRKQKHKALLKMALLTLSTYLVTTIIAVITGLIMVNVIKPGQVVINNDPTTNSTAISSTRTAVSTSPQVVTTPLSPSNMISLNGELYPLRGLLLKRQEIVSSEIMSTGNNSHTNSSSSYKQIVSIIESFIPSNLIDAASAENGGSVNVLGLIVFSIFMAIVMIQIGEPAKPVIKFFKSLNEIILKMVAFIICYAPIGIMFLIIWRCVKEKYLLQSLSQLLIYMLTVLSGLVIHSFVTLTIIYLALVRKNILRHVWSVFPALLTALGTSSSSATLPLTMKCCEEKIGAQKEVASFVLPLGSTVNMDGTALYEAVAAIFIAQSLQVSLGIGDMFVVAITATLASIGAAGIPEAGLVTLILVIESVGLPKEAVSLILAVDWFLDRFRTCVNVYGDTVCVAIVDKYVRFDRLSSTKELDNSHHGENNSNRNSEIPLYNISENTKLV
ncbi:hypothetical protein C9374_008298 [Naegleria lovaniensis]|uniref:Amino acid transporter n=1 Tax=Naegleria lovaniensis TaxID=51637 RepID=A0AA88KLA0_NAELO|nr:uncharacterized protein C9374_008298 [Naegleria lovaniensis]KAG2378659.1 hypothetical protein C9374_008298 [Naegleria lovaniensis]